MATKRKTPADIVTLQRMVQAQAVTIDNLEKKLAEGAKAKDEAMKTSERIAKERDEFKEVVEQAHDLMDACPAALPRRVKRQLRWGEEEQETSLIVRMGSWLGATKAKE